MSKAAQAAKNVMIRLIVPAGGASPSPPVGPALGARGVKSIDFCKEFNARTANLEPGLPVPTVVTVKPNRTFTFETRSPPASYLLMKAAGIEKGAHTPGTEVSGQVSLKHIYEIALIKSKDHTLAGVPLESVARSVLGTAKAAGIKVVP